MSESTRPVELARVYLIAQVMAENLMQTPAKLDELVSRRVNALSTEKSELITDAFQQIKIEAADQNYSAALSTGFRYIDWSEPAQSHYDADDRDSASAGLIGIVTRELDAAREAFLTTLPAEVNSSQVLERAVDLVVNDTLSSAIQLGSGPALN